MSLPKLRWLLPVLLTVVAAGTAGAQVREPSEHDELEASLSLPYAAARGASRELAIALLFPGADKVAVAWQLQIVDADGNTRRQWSGTALAGDRRQRLHLPWDGRDATRQVLPEGIYHARLATLAGTPQQLQDGLAAARVDNWLSNPVPQPQQQEWDLVVGGVPQAAMPAFDALPHSSTPAALRSSNALYTVYLGNLHSQTNHSDGGGDLSTCNNAETPQAGAYGPDAAFAYADARGLDFLMASEHNHMYDGRANGVNAAATPLFANNLFAAGLAQASAYNAAHSGFLALYGMEWGVTSDGGHLNVIGADGLYNWEYNSTSQLIGSYFTAKSDYAALYTFMHERQVLGQFNHPDTSGQFVIDATALAYHADGDAVMVLTEVLNSSAFSVSTDETETSRSSYEGAWRRLLERGFHTAPASNQDNHCANWGASYTNRTGVLLPSGQTLNEANFVAALRARRVFATMDKNSQLILTANGRVMGERFSNSGSLNLVANFANSAGRTASQVRIYEGVPGRNGTVTQLSAAANVTITPSAGVHFYYAKVTQDDGKILWSAPVWVTQGSGGGDTTPPTVSASVSGSSGTIALNATAGDNVGVSQVEFRVDGVLKGSDSSAPYSLNLDSTTLSNGSHSLIVRAYDAAGNSANSAAVNFSVSNSSGGTPVERIVNGGFESGTGSWTATSGVITSSSSVAAHGGSWKAWMNGYGSTATDTVYQSVAIPATATQATLSFWLDVITDETSTTQAWDTLTLELRNSSNAVIATLATYSNLNAPGGYTQKTFNLLPYKGQTVRVYFKGVEGSQVATSFIVDDVSLVTQ